MAVSCYGMVALSCAGAGRDGLNRRFGGSNYGVLPLRDVKFRVRSSAEDEKTKETGSSSKFTPKPKASTRFSDVFAFSGPAPERINGRLAMLGFVTAIGVELASGRDIFSQLQSGGVPWFVFTSALFTVASLVPLFDGQTAESKSDGVMTSDAEIWNGRFAMVGLVALALTEYLKGSALV